MEGLILYSTLHPEIKTSFKAPKAPKIFGFTTFTSWNKYFIKGAEGAENFLVLPSLPPFGGGSIQARRGGYIEKWAGGGGVNTPQYPPRAHVW